MDSESLEELNVNYKELRSLIEILEKRIQYLQSNASQLAGAYVIFEGIMYMQVLLPSVTVHGTWWIPLCLSAFVSIAFWLSFINSVRDWVRVRGQQDRVFMEQERLYRKIYSTRSGRSQNDDALQSLAKPFAFVRFQRYACVGAIHCALFSFTLLLSYALLTISKPL
ncbi:hypothetical protein BUALT_Bualt10G0087900 [Buddleja alternifolia]|uniref:Gustatory receptor n=1 Tax=Buddleja alternifolia TaxID=168488 RepID=A0AAV6W1K1_9LAMI|nr:hypothetical protein BUALT_BualtUnG0001500 [Buddleja alternifolia]KAG8375319.1 hypothetical protein BUALT_Bualt10G0087900 [Buddleja alternifolia]